MFGRTNINSKIKMKCCVSANISGCGIDSSYAKIFFSIIFWQNALGSTLTGKTASTGNSSIYYFTSRLDWSALGKYWGFSAFSMALIEIFVFPWNFIKFSRMNISVIAQNFSFLGHLHF